MTSNKYLPWCAIGLGILLATSCAKVEELQTPEAEATEEEAPLVTFRASTEQKEGTKTTLDEDFVTILWKGKETINVINGSQNKPFVADVGDDEIVNVANFQGHINIDASQPIYAVYPYNEKASLINGDKILTDLPSFQEGVPNNFANNLFPGVAKAQPGADHLSFKNIGTGLRFMFSEAGYTSVKLTGNANELIAGPVLIGFDAAGMPQPDTNFSGDLEDEYGRPTTSVTVTAPNGGTFVPGTWYYLICLPGTFQKGITLTMTGPGGVSYYRTDEPITFERSAFKQATNLDKKPEVKQFAPEYVDLGLSVRWATTNVGSSDPTGYGDFFAWGETTPKTEFLRTDYKWGTFDKNQGATLTKYNLNPACGPVDGKWILDPEDDAATVNWGDGWRTPTAAELAELQRECSWTWQDDYNNSGVPGFLVTGPNGNSIFIAASGINEPRRVRWNGTIIGASLLSSNSATGTTAGEYDNGYWLLTMTSPDHLMDTYGSGEVPFIDGETPSMPVSPAIARYCRYDGLPVRPVYAPLPNENEIVPLIVFNDPDSEIYDTDQPRLAVNTIPHNLGKEMVFESKDPDILTIDQQGYITAYQSGWAKVTVSFQDGSGYPLEYYVYAEGATPGSDPDEAITFADDALKQRLVEKGVDTDGDGEISMAEAAAVTSLEGIFYSGESFTSFDEFQYFTGIETIPDSQFKIWQSLVSITLPKNVTSIETDAFFSCKNLTSINIPEGVITIGARAFGSCSNLASLILPEGVASIGEGAFRFCTKLTSINIPEGVTSIEDFTFQGCSTLTSINIPEGVTTIGENAFSNCTSLTSINLPEGITSIGSFAFAYARLTTIHIPESVTSIGDNPFRSCTTLESITGKFTSPDGLFLMKDGKLIATAPASMNGDIAIPDSVTSIGVYAFSNCTDLISTNIPEGVTLIDVGTFYSCTNLVSIGIPEGVISIETNAFRFCHNLTSINIPESVTSIAVSAFQNCSGLQRFSGKFATADGLSLVNDGKIIAIAKASMQGDITIPVGVETITNGVFQDCTGLTSVTISEGITTIESNAFARCTGLMTLSIPSSVTTIGMFAFSSCSILTSVTIHATTPPTGQMRCFDFGADQKFYVPAESLETYKSTSPWSSIPEGNLLPIE